MNDFVRAHNVSFINRKTNFNNAGLIAPSNQSFRERSKKKRLKSMREVQQEK